MNHEQPTSEKEQLDMALGRLREAADDMENLVLNFDKFGTFDRNQVGDLREYQDQPGNIVEQCENLAASKTPISSHQEKIDAIEKHLKNFERVREIILGH